MIRPAATWLVVCAAGVVHSESAWEIKSQAMVGLDFWQVNHNTPPGMMRKATFVADQNTHWSFRPASPWYQLESTLSWEGRGQWVLKARANQATGSELNQLFYDHAVSPRLGVRVGVVDYRVSWCRSLDTDNPWIRETDPFCADSTIKLATDSSPGLQVYTIWPVGDYVVQSLAGLYRPQLGRYAPKEYSDAILGPDDRVTHNHKYGVTVNAINTQTATEWRLGWVGADQAAEYGSPGFEADSAQSAHLFFAGYAWSVHPQLKARVTLMRSHLRARITPHNGDRPFEPRVFKGSAVLELNYQYNPRNALALAYSYYPFEQRGVYKWRHESLALAWRHDYGRRWFTAIQLSGARNRIVSNDPKAPVQTGQPRATSIGFRIGYKL